MRPTILLLFILYTFFCKAQESNVNRWTPPDSSLTSIELSDTVLKLIGHFKGNENVVDGAYIGIGGAESDRYNNFELLKKVASTKELMALTDSPYPSVRCYSFWALLDRKDADYFSLIVRHVNDNEKIDFRWGCDVSSLKVGDFFILPATDNSYEGTIKLNDTQAAQLDSILIFSRCDLEAREKAIRKIGSDALYPKFRTLVVQNGDVEALLFLSTYKKEGDAELIRKTLENAGSKEDDILYKVVLNFTHPSFFPFVEKKLNQAIVSDTEISGLRELYEAIASYGHERSAPLLKHVFLNAKRNALRITHLRSIYLAIDHLPEANRNYNDLLWQLWEEEGLVSGMQLDKFIAQDTMRALKLTQIALADVISFNKQSLWLGGFAGCHSSVMSDMILFSYSKDPVRTIELIKGHIAVGDGLYFCSLTNIIHRLRDTALVQPLFIRLEAETKPSIFFDIAGALIAYDETVINDRIKAIYERSPIDKIENENAYREIWPVSVTD